MTGLNYNDFTQYIIPKMGEILSGAAAYGIDLGSRTVDFLLYKNILVLSLSLLATIFCIISLIKCYKDKKDKRDIINDDEPDGECIVIYIFLLWISIAIDFILVQNILKIIFIPEVSVLEYAKDIFN